MRALTRRSEARLSCEVMPVTIVQSTIGTTIILMQLSQMSPMKPS